MKSLQALMQEQLPQGGVTIPPGRNSHMEVVGSTGNDDQMPLPEGASLKTIKLQEPWVVPLPTPTTTLWDFSSGLRSFQGPVTLPENRGQTTIK